MAAEETTTFEKMEGEEGNFYSSTLADSKRSSHEEGVAYDSGDLISGLPDLVQDKVLGLVGVRDKARAAQVCSSWCAAVYRPRHWRQVKVKLDLDSLSEEDLDSLKKRKICHVEIQRCMDSDKMTHFLQEMSGLVSFVTTTFSQTELFLASISHCSFGSLEKLTLLLGDVTQDLVLQESLTEFPKLHTLEITGFVSTDLVEAIGRELSGLQSLMLTCTTSSSPLNIKGLGNLGGLQSLGLDNFQLRGTQVLCKPEPTLKRLTLECCRLCPEDEVTDVSSLSSLEELTLLLCKPEVGKSELELLSTMLINLKRFTFSGARPCLLDDGIIRSVTRMSSLQEICLYKTSNVGDEGIHALAMNLRNLTALTLGNCSGITDKGMEHFEKMPALQKLCLQNGSHADVLMGALRRSSCQLKVLRLTHFAGTGDEALIHIAQMSTLLDLTLDNVSVGASGMEILAQGTFSLGSLEVRYCGVTVEGLRPLFERQTALHTLMIMEEGLVEERASFLMTCLPYLRVCMIKNSKL